ncbi:hypothetical protein NVP1031O_109 [Vibrio phage 1.031.O._10N.261.46.F8]|nr:hypothetical protein NVP1031O_109 [Vibrio phage 1.031.O._10N.261.46.F8]
MFRIVAPREDGGLNVLTRGFGGPNFMIHEKYNPTPVDYKSRGGAKSALSSYIRYKRVPDNSFIQEL